MAPKRTLTLAVLAGLAASFAFRLGAGQARRERAQTEEAEAA
jgi:hypothetical protein